MELPNGRIVPLSQLRGVVRVVLLAGPLAFVRAALSIPQELQAALLERGVMVVPLVTEAGESAQLPSDIVGFANSMGWGPDREARNVDVSKADGGGKEKEVSSWKRWLARPTFSGEWMK